MNHVEFRYWIKGYYELTGGVDFEPDQVEMLLEHAELARENSGCEDNFTSWLIGVLQAIMASPDDIKPKFFELMHEKLESEFVKKTKKVIGTKATFGPPKNVQNWSRFPGGPGGGRRVC
tara:strand:+ start:120569 stop:120925 length:357 start_codon:yes stop_codon:yes gene_type:complete